VSVDRWVAGFQVWPHSSGRGGETDQKEAGERDQQFEFTADVIDAALVIAKAFKCGLERNPMVWQAPIFKLERSR